MNYPASSECWPCTVAVFPAKPTRTNHIRVIFKGEISSLLKDKESITLFNKVKTLPIAKDDENGSKSHILEAKAHTFPFEFMVPEDIPLPSSMEVFKQGRIRYTLIAIQGKPMMPESLCPKATYNVPILEHIDISVPEYTRPTEKSVSTTLEGVEDRRKVTVKVNIPRYGYTRGDIVPLNISIGHHSAFSREKGIKVEFVRIGQFSSNRQMITNELTLRTSESNINIYGPYNFSQSLTEQIMIPTSTPPTIDKKGKLIYINYKVRVTVNLNSKHSSKTKNIVVVELPIVVGTWPRAAVPIDEDEEWMEAMDDMMLSDEDPEPDNDSLYDYNTHDQSSMPDLHPVTTSSSNATPTVASSEWRLSIASTSSSTSSATATGQHRGGLMPSTDNGVIRSDSTASRASVKSFASVSSQRSTHSLDSSQERLARNTSIGTNASAPELPTASVRYVRTAATASSTPPYGPAVMLKSQGNYIPRSSSVTDLTRPVPPTVQTPYIQPSYDDSGLYRQRSAGSTNEHLRGEPKRFNPAPNYGGGMNNNSSSNVPYGPPLMYHNAYDPYGYGGPSPSNGRQHMRTPSDSAHLDRLYHTQPPSNHPAKYSPMPAVPDTQRNLQAPPENHHANNMTNLPQFTPPRNFDYNYPPPHRHSDPQASTSVHPPVTRADSDPSRYGLEKSEEPTVQVPTPPETATVDTHHNYYYSSDSSSDYGNGDAAGSASDDSDDSADEGDLLRIVEKKRRQEQKEMKRRQRRVFTIAE
ncbi:hypothetical protein NQZ79_g3489 [Umbelopsis isabellina]|nr:hypothetical protein NQZ79_g3489 [Umbelopsis isabellina]